MTENEAKVVISGDATSATTSAQEAASAYEGAFALMKAKLTEVGFAFKEVFTGMAESANHGAIGVQVASEKIAASSEMMRGSAERVKGSWESVGGAMSKLNGLFLGLTAALAGGEVFEHAVEASTKYTTEVEKLSRAFGISLPQADGFHAALHKLGIETDTMTALSAKMVRQMRGHEDAFNRLGIVTRDTEGHFRNLQDITLDSLERLRDYQAGVDRTGAAQVLFGRGTGDLTSMLKLNREELDEGAKTARELGLVTTNEGVAANREYKQSVREVNEVWEAFQIQIGRSVLPYLTRMATWFQENGPAAIHQTVSVLHELASAFAEVPAEFKLWEAGFIKLWNSFALTLEDMNRRAEVFQLRIKLLGEVITLAMSGNWTSIGQVWDRGTALIDAYSERTANHIIAKWKDVSRALADAQAALESARNAGEKDMRVAGGPFSSAALHASMHLYGGGEADPVPLGGDRLDNIAQGHDPKAKKEKAPKSRMEDWDADLADQQRAYAMQMQKQDSFQEWSAASTAAYWSKILEIGNLSTAERNGATDKWLTAEKQARKEAFDAQIADLQERIVAAKNNGDLQVALAQQIVQKIKAKYGEQSAEYRQAVSNMDRLAEQSAQMQVTLANEVANARKAAELDALEQDIAAAQHRVDMGIAQKSEMLTAQRSFEARRHAIIVESIEADIAAAQNDPYMSPVALKKLHSDLDAENRRYLAATRTLERQAELQRTADARQAINSVSSGWAQALAKMATLQASFSSTIKSLWGAVATTIGDVLAKMIEKYIEKWLTAMAIKIGLTKAENAATITGEAAKAGAGGTASMAAAPFPLNLSAPGFGASMFAASMSYIPMAAKGFDIPAGVNPLTQLHQREMVLPEKFANVIRGMADGKGGGRDGGFHYHDHTGTLTPAQIMANKDAVVKLMKMAHKQGAFAGL
jgi:hypothetical protein